MVAITQPSCGQVLAHRSPAARAPSARRHAPPPLPFRSRRARRSAVRLALASVVVVVLIVAAVNMVTYLGAVLGAEGAGGGTGVIAGAGHSGAGSVAERVDPPSPSRPTPTALYIVQPGDTLWSIAAGIAPGADPRPTVDRLARRNGGASLEAGQRLVLE